MSVTVDELERKARELSVKQRGELISRLLATLEGEPEGTPEEIAAAWDEEIGRRIDDMEAGRTQWVSEEDVRAAGRAIIDARRK